MPEPERRSRADTPDHPRRAIGPGTTKVPKQPDRLPLNEAREALAEHMSDAFAAVQAFHDAAQVENAVHRPPRLLIEAGLGLGKTEAAITQTVTRIMALWAEGHGGVAVYATPTHRLGDELAERIRGRDAGVRVVVLRGREAGDPAAPEQHMCRNMFRIREALADLVPTGSVCNRCLFARSCAYLAQEDAEADIYIITHNRLIAGAVPQQIKLAGIDHLVVDENPTGSLLFGVDGPPVELPLAAIATAPSARPPFGLDPELVDARSKLAEALARPGPVQADALLAAGLDAGRCACAADAEWRRRASLKDGREALKANRCSATIWVR